MATRRRPWWLLGLAVLAVLLVTGASGSWVVWRHFHQGQRMRIPGEVASPSAPWPTPAPGRQARPSGPPFVTSVSPNGRYFLDQYGRPLLLKGDSPWALLTRLSPPQARLWFADRQRQGFNAAIVSLVGAVANGAPSDDGATFDGLLPFAGGDILRWQAPYWERVTAYLRLAAEHGITVVLLPIDGWTIGRSFVPKSIRQCQRYGGMVAQRFRDLPNIVWMSGGDYYVTARDPARGTDVDHCIDAMMRGIREAGDGRPFSLELKARKSISTDNPYWARRVEWNFVYTYYPTYKAVLDARRRRPAIPAVLGEANYEGENNQHETPPTTDETLRRQVLWSLTSGAAGEFFGSRDWAFQPGWEQRLSTRALTQVTRLRSLFSRLRWWQLAPDTAGELVTGGRGTELTTDQPMDVLENDYVTAARTADGRLAVIYLPARHTISVNRSAMAAGARAAWIDPTSGRRRPVAMSGTFTTPGANAAGGNDWLLVLSS
ncbi:MAG TPA: DUF4038 domain-containing protein [Actinomycetes bacterium]|nr:DUF4038 domain-containing protein [Actinomycetes bacterium]